MGVFLITNSGRQNDIVGTITLDDGWLKFIFDTKLDLALGYKYDAEKILEFDLLSALKEKDQCDLINCNDRDLTPHHHHQHGTYYFQIACQCSNGKAIKIGVDDA